MNHLRKRGSIINLFEKTVKIIIAVAFMLFLSTISYSFDIGKFSDYDFSFNNISGLELYVLLGIMGLILVLTLVPLLKHSKKPKREFLDLLFKKPIIVIDDDTRIFDMFKQFNGPKLAITLTYQNDIENNYIISTAIGDNVIKPHDLDQLLHRIMTFNGAVYIEGIESILAVVNFEALRELFRLFAKCNKPMIIRISDACFTKNELKELKKLVFVFEKPILPDDEFIDSLTQTQPQQQKVKIDEASVNQILGYLKKQTDKGIAVQTVMIKLKDVGWKNEILQETIRRYYNK